MGNHLLMYSTFDTVHNFLFSLSPFPWHRSTALGVAAISLKEGQLGRIVAASLWPSTSWHEIVYCSGTSRSPSFWEGRFPGLLHSELVITSSYRRVLQNWLWHLNPVVRPVISPAEAPNKPSVLALLVSLWVLFPIVSEVSPTPTSFLLLPELKQIRSSTTQHHPFFILMDF